MAKKEGTLHMLKDDGKSIIESHGFNGGYLEPIQQGNEEFANGEYTL